MSGGRGSIVKPNGACSRKWDLRRKVRLDERVVKVTR
jgi:hypothetical protein